MGRPILRLNDGFDHTSPHLRDEVREFQAALIRKGFSLETDGLFGRDTENAVKRFQREHDLAKSRVGIVASPTPAQSLAFQKILTPSRAEHGPRRRLAFPGRSLTSGGWPGDGNR
ncbi:MAG: peptidoglycan-binding protein [Acidobacteriota bacterium]